MKILYRPTKRQYKKMHDAQKNSDRVTVAVLYYQLFMRNYIVTVLFQE